MDRETGYEDPELLTATCDECRATFGVHPDEPLSEGPLLCAACERIDPIALAERNGLDAVMDLRVALGKCETVAQALALKQRISALWLAWDALDQDVLRKADAILNEAAELHSTKVA